MNLQYLFNLTILVTYFNFGHSYKILVVFPIPQSSHFILGSTLAKGLANAGHDVTFLSSTVDKHPPENGTYRQLVLHQLHQEYERHNVNMFELMSSIFQTLKFFNVLNSLTELVINSTEVEELVNNKEEFDAVIIEEFMTDALKVFQYLFNAKLIAYSPVGPNYMINDLVGNPSALAYVPEIDLSFTNPMSFADRAENFLMYISDMILKHWVMKPAQEELLRKYHPNAPSIDELRSCVFLILMNSHISTHQATPIVPGMIPIGGYHVQPSKGFEDQELKEFLDNADEGVIYFSLGSILKSTDLPKEKVNILLNTFGQLKQKVVWKWENDELPSKPKNVKIMKWSPQQEILGHPNVKLFISHGGLLSTIETIYHGKPVLAIPIFGDQPSNTQQMVDAGFALRHDYHNLTDSEELLAKIIELLNNPRYYDNAQLRSRIFHDREVKPMDTIIFWVEYVIRHNGASHLKVAGINLPWYKYYLIDVILFMFITIVISISIFLWIMLHIFKICLRKTNVTNMFEYKKIN